MLHRSAFFLLSLPAFSQIPFTQFVVFGDSLSDNGNLYYGTTLLGLPTPGPPSYATGEYTDGTNSVPPTTGPLGLWIEQLAPKLNLPVPQPFADGKGGTNYAVAGALTGENPAFSPTTISAIPGLTDQLNLFLAANPTPAVNALYAFWGGANDIFGGVSPTTAASNVQGNINTLATLGAKYFLWANLPLVGEVPEYIGTANRIPFDQASMAYNQAQTAAIAQLKAAHPGITIILLDAYSLFLSIGLNTSTYGFVNITSPAQGMTNVNPNTYLFWDMLHPTTVGHGYVADVAYSSILAAFGGPGYSCSNTTAPVVTAVDSASAYGDGGVGYSYFASGSWLEIKGTNLADPTDPRLTAAVNPGQWTASDFNGVNAPTVLDGISVTIDGKPGYVWYLSPGQINVQAPEDSNIGNVPITVTNCKASSSPFMFTKRALAPGLLAPQSFNISGTQYMVATFTSDGAYVLNTSAGVSLGLNSRPAKSGDLIIAYGVGFGDVTPQTLPGTIETQANSVNDAVAFSFGSTPATLSYSGLAPNFVGLYEFYVTVPSGLANGDNQINVTQNGTPVPQTLYLTIQN
jgi:uncharacterized protein (TIGR03437 family)